MYNTIIAIVRLKGRCVLHAKISLAANCCCISRSPFSCVLSLKRGTLKKQPMIQISFSSLCHAEVSGQECSTSGREYLAYFMHRHLDFRLAEVDSLMEGLGLSQAPSRWRQPYGGQQYSPFWYLKLPSDEVARQLTRKSILLKASLQHSLFRMHASWIAAWPALYRSMWMRAGLFGCLGGGRNGGGTAEGH